MGDSRYEAHYTRVTGAADVGREIVDMPDDAIIQALAAASTHPPSPYLANILASEALNRLRRGRLVYEHIADGIFTLGADGHILDANPAARRLLGYPNSDLIGRSMAEICPATGREEHRCPYHDALEGALVQDTSDTFRAADGRVLHVAYSAAPIPGVDEPQGAIIAWRDVTAAKEWEARLVESEARYRSLFDHSADLVITLDARGRITALNPAGEAIARTTAEAVRGLTILPFLAPEDQERAQRILEGAFSGHPQQGEFTITQPDGSRIVYDALSVPIVVDGKVVGVHGVARNITHVRHLEEGIRVNEARHQLIMAGVKDHAIILLGRDGEVASWNPGAELLFGWNEAEALGKRYVDLFRDEATTRAQAMRHLELAQRAGRAEIESHARRADGRAMFLTGVLNSVRDTRGVHYGFVAVLRDSSIRHRAQVELQRAVAIADAFQPARDTLIEGVVRIERGRIEAANTSFLEMLDRPLEHVLHQPFAAYLAPRAVKAFERLLHEDALGPERFETTLCDKEGIPIPVRVTACRVEPQEGAPAESWVLVMRPVREGIA